MGRRLVVPSRLFVDEPGPLEFRNGGGFAAIEARRYRLVVVRAELLDAALARWPWVAAIYDKDLP